MEPMVSSDSTASGQVEGEVEQVLDAGGRDEVLVLQPNAGAQLGAIHARLGGEDLALHESIVPLGIQVRVLMRLKADAVAEVVGHPFGAARIEVLIDRVENL